MANNYFKSIYGELRHVSWPTRSQAIWFTVLVIALSLATAAYLGALDWVFTNILKLFI